MKSIQNQRLIDHRNGLLREAEYLQKRLKIIYDKVTELNTIIQPVIALKPGDPDFQWPACSQCGSRSFRCGCD